MKKKYNSCSYNCLRPSKSKSITTGYSILNVFLAVNPSFKNLKNWIIGNVRFTSRNRFLNQALENNLHKDFNRLLNYKKIRNFTYDFVMKVIFRFK